MKHRRVKINLYYYYPCWGRLENLIWLDSGFFSKSIKSENFKKMFLLKRIEIMNKIGHKKEVFGYNDTLNIYEAPKVSTVYGHCTRINSSLKYLINKHARLFNSIVLLHNTLSCKSKHLN